MFLIRLFLLLGCAILIEPVLSTATTEVFIATSAPYRKHKNNDDIVSSSSPHRSMKVVSTASDAAVAINSEEFMNILVGKKTCANVNTYTQAIEHDYDDHCTHHSQTKNKGGSWMFSRWIFGGGGDTSSPGDDDTNRNNCLSNNSRVPSTHETITEYIGKLWFLSDKKGMRFRETIRVIATSSDGQSSTVECISQYHNGSKWIDCSKVICTFHVDSSGKENKDKVKMVLKSEILIWLPLPSKAIGKKIINVFEEAALAYFDDLAAQR